MVTLRNLTLHPQGEREVTLAARYGLALTPKPEGVSVEPGEDGLERAALCLAARLRQCRQRGEAALVGGHTGAWLAAAMRLVTQGEALPALYYFDTRRVQDTQGRFVFVPEGLVRVSW
jgi:thioesterase domain-containing protein